jgi:hypothetical protein
VVQHHGHPPKLQHTSACLSRRLPQAVRLAQPGDHGSRRGRVALDQRRDGFPDRDSDFVVLGDDGIRQVISGLANKWFISSSDPYGYDGEFGGIDTGCPGNGNVSPRCVGQ